MKEITISSIFKEAGCRISYDVLAVTQNGKLYNIGHVKAANGKISEAIVLDDNVSENKAKVEFLRNYLRSGNLKLKTKKYILDYIKKLEEENDLELENESNISTSSYSKIYSDNICGVEQSIIVEKSNKNNYKQINTLNTNYLADFIYNINKHDIRKMASLIIESRMNNVSPYTLSNKYEVGPGTIHTWYKDINELRILYTFYYILEYDEIKSILSNYDASDIMNFEDKLINDVQVDDRLDENIKKIYIDLVNENKYEEEISSISDIDKYMKKIILGKILNGSTGLSQEFISKKKQEILNLIINNDEMQAIIIDNIELEI